MDLRATLDYKDAFMGAQYIIICTPTNYDDEKNFFDTSSVEDIICKVKELGINTTMIIKSTVPVGFTKKAKEKYNVDLQIQITKSFINTKKIYIIQIILIGFTWSLLLIFHKYNS